MRSNRIAMVFTKGYAPAFLIILAGVGGSGTAARTLTVGPNQAFSKPSLAASAAQDGDTVLFDAAVFAGDAATWSADRLTLRAASRYAHMRADGAQAGGKGTWVITGDDCRVENIEFSGAKVPDGNGAGIRQEGLNPFITHCYFHDNENGILTGAAKSEIVIEYSVFTANGAGDGYTHNMYIGDVSSFTLRYCHTQKAKVGHNIKSRAAVNFISYNLSDNGGDGASSYELDMPNGGSAYVIGNVFQQSAATENPTLLAYGEEGLTHPGKELYVVNNTFVNDRASGGTFISIAAGTTAAKVQNNLFVGGGAMLAGKADTASNLQTNAPGFLNKAAGDFRIGAASPAIDKGTDAGKAGPVSLAATGQYLAEAEAMVRPVKGVLDVGAFEYDPGAAIRPRNPSASVTDVLPAGIWRWGGWRDAEGRRQIHPNKR